MPPWMPPEWRRARQEWRRRERQAGAGGGERHESLDEFSRLPRDHQIRRFRQRAARTAITVGVLAGINVIFTPGFPWFLFPAFGMSLGLLHRAASLWGDGIRFRDVFGREAADRLARGSDQPAARTLRAPPGDPAEQLAPAEVLAGPFGGVVRRAASDRAAAHEALARLSPPDRALIPDVGPTVNALAERVGSIAHALHRLDEDLADDALGDLDRVIAEAKAQADTPQRAQRLALLERRRTTLADLAARREQLQARLDSAALLLQNMRLDLLALRSAGVQSAINDVTTATQEARALSRDIQIALEAAREIRT
jgi:hypothetical protein